MYRKINNIRYVVAATEYSFYGYVFGTTEFTQKL